MRRPRVVITGMGVVAANGIGLPAFWDSLVRGKSGVRPITLFDASKHFLRIAGEVKGFDFSSMVDMPMKAKRLGRHTQFAIATTDMAIRDAGLDRETMKKSGSIPITLGVSTCAMELIEAGMHQLFDHGPHRFSPYIVSYALPHGITHTLLEYLGVDADGRTVSSACQSGAEAIAQSYEFIRKGQAQIAIAGGADAPLTPFTVAAFCAGGLRPSEYNEDNPEGASRPFDLKRTGGILAEGGGVLVLENLDHAKARGARIYAEVRGCASQADAPGGLPVSGLANTMKMAMCNSRMYPHDIDYINAHGPSEPVMDKVETDMIKNVFGDHARSIPVSSIKGVSANALSAQGPMQLIAATLALGSGEIPPTANLEFPDPECDLDYVPRTARKVNIDTALINAHGLGGGNTTIVISSLE
ncbi:MAG TPA: beta-ketoacyl-[acyl-carrier-protein] synthase family protein [Kiritimatiellia bacterium]|nr:beta-ketoacyl-[acyl-carrier-protein] synthase family protein [Kiritimatiellia bacterium]HMO52465.1 beta-ketoacyl-[acyl-carrier-protein] synthase family protein [Kiritimatiellia bacterium]HMP00069.1 beta-ketoacyl-[acyl-carrier-protein] synthase family protein [Kiritimatiellia bacterium]